MDFTQIGPYLKRCAEMKSIFSAWFGSAGHLYFGIFATANYYVLHGAGRPERIQPHDENARPKQNHIGDRG